VELTHARHQLLAEAQGRRDADAALAKVWNHFAKKSQPVTTFYLSSDRSLNIISVFSDGGEVLPCF